jgi:hypothetical protein
MTVTLVLCSITCLGACQAQEKEKAQVSKSSPETKPDTQAASQNFTDKLEGKGDQGLYHFKLRMDPESPKLNEMFKAVLTLTDVKTGAPVTDAEVKVNATMPEHRHGMMTAPSHEELGKGQYLTKGMKLHMHGSWEVRVDAKGKAGMDHIDWRYHQKPIAKE